MNNQPDTLIRYLVLTAIFLLSSLGQYLMSQSQYAISGPVSQLTLNAKDQITCELHLGDAVSTTHHALANRLQESEITESTDNANSKAKRSGGAQIIVDYYNFDPSFPLAQLLQAIQAFQTAVDIWASLINSSEPIYLAAVFQPLGDGVLGSAGPTQIYANYPGLERNTWYGNALADKLAGEDLNPVVYDIVANFSTVFTNWYFGTDGNTPASDFDFLTVVLHELCHGLGFFGSMFVDNATGIGDYGFGIPDPVFPVIYDRLPYSPDGKSILKDNRYPNFSTALGDVLLGDPLLAKGPRIKKASNGQGAALFTVLDSGVFGPIPGLTDIWLPGSSYSHLDYLSYAGTPEGLMVPFLSRGVSISDPGDIALAILDDIGWNGKVNRQVVNGRTALAEPEIEVVLDEFETVLKVYPNPVHDRFTVALNQRAQVTSATLMDVIGRQYPLTGQSIDNRAIGFDLSQQALTPGLYILQLSFDNQQKEQLRLLKR